MTIRTIFILFISLGLAYVAKAQDPHFSQFYNAPTYFSPAMTGVFNGSVRAHANYRDQWSAILGNVPYRTISAGADIRMFGVNEDFAGVGLNLMRDQAGSANFSITQAALSFAYMKKLSQGQYSRNVSYLVAGAQGGYAQRGVDYTNFRYSLQYDGEAYNPNYPTGEADLLLSKPYADLSAGLMWYAVLDRRSSIFFGGALHHINQGNISLREDQVESIDLKWTVHGGGEFPVSREVSLLPGAVFMMQGPSMQIKTGMNFRYSGDDWREVAFRVGLWNRIVKRVVGISNESIIAMAGIEYNEFQLGLSYDINTSPLSASTQSRGAFEISLIYIHAPRQDRRMSCPRF